MRRALVASVSILLLSGAAQAQMPGPNLAPPPAATLGQPQQQEALVTAPRQVIDDRVAFNSAERWIIPTFYQRVREKQKRAARSKKYERVLPAGITADPAKGEQLPMTLLARLDRLPGPLLRELPPNRPETDRVLVGKNVLMVNTATGEVLDILSGVLY
ncbi:hypothetical protein [Ferrovibrio sp.]|uniref:hypothetical protein n=1 Tax=Ferrovibrio sp. TaxID=1917215 RepID=UPI000CB3B89F|nr:hypothetical protein [Ferrovibrio sp.]PJI37627.1 MAG: hypothetical protein CTR53_19275 [Ferrovibrio sp.]